MVLSAANWLLLVACEVVPVAATEAALPANAELAEPLAALIADVEALCADESAPEITAATVFLVTCNVVNVPLTLIPGALPTPVSGSAPVVVAPVLAAAAVEAVVAAVDAVVAAVVAVVSAVVAAVAVALAASLSA